MAGRDHARLLIRIWKDRSWKRLSGNAQRMYMLLLSQQTLNYAGVQPLMDRVWANMCADWSTDDVMAALKELGATQFVIVDEDTDEVLVRSFIRNDELWKQPKMLNLAIADATGVESYVIRRALAAELRRLPLASVTVTRSEIESQVAGALEVLDSGSDTPPDNPSGGGAAPPAEGLSSPSAGDSSPPMEGVGDPLATGPRAYARAAPGSYSSSDTNNTLPPGADAPESEIDNETTGELLHLPVPPRPKAVEPDPDLFDEFWAVYPRKKDKGHARKAWASALKRGVDPQKIIAAAQAYRADPERIRSGDRYTAFPATWLNGERYDDKTDQPQAAASNGHVPFRNPTDPNAYTEDL